MKTKRHLCLTLTFLAAPVFAQVGLPGAGGPSTKEEPVPPPPVATAPPTATAAPSTTPTPTATPAPGATPAPSPFPTPAPGRGPSIRPGGGRSGSPHGLPPGATPAPAPVRELPRDLPPPTPSPAKAVNGAFIPAPGTPGAQPPTAVPGVPGGFGYQYIAPGPGSAPAPESGSSGYDGRPGYGYAGQKFRQPVETYRDLEAPPAGDQIIRTIKLKVFQRHFETALSESVELEKALLDAPSEKRGPMEAKLNALRGFASKLEGNIQSLTAQGPKAAIQFRRAQNEPVERHGEILTSGAHDANGGPVIQGRGHNLRLFGALQGASTEGGPRIVTRTDVHPEIHITGPEEIHATGPNRAGIVELVAPAPEPEVALDVPTPETPTLEEPTEPKVTGPVASDEPAPPPTPVDPPAPVVPPTAGVRP